MQDEFDRKGGRALLNLGHTFGHAAEAAAGFKRLHGECVAWGICCAIDLSARLGLADPQLMRVPALLSRLGLPTRLERLPMAKLMRAMSEDKKFEKGMRFIVPLRLGKSKLLPVKSAALIRSIIAGRLAA
jgi:3-dehydroquinate synthase